MEFPTLRFGDSDIVLPGLAVVLRAWLRGPPTGGRWPCGGALRANSGKVLRRTKRSIAARSRRCGSLRSRPALNGVDVSPKCLSVR